MCEQQFLTKRKISDAQYYEGWNFNSGNYLFTTDTK